MTLDRPPQISPLELVPESIVEQLNFSHVFGREAPVEIDIGCGDGAFIVEMAKRYPDRDFLGTERLLGRVRKSCRRALNAGLQNVRVLQLESLYTTRYLLPPGSISVFHVLFADPWPKRKHQRRRLINPPFLDAARTALTSEGVLNIVTDHRDYAAYIREVISGRSDFVEIPHPPDLEYPMTDFEKRFREQNLPIYRIRLAAVNHARK
jgi:tRNA (guanine-N7-)-methyltransferase